MDGNKSDLRNVPLALAPCQVGGIACQYTASVIAKMGLEARVSLLDAEMVGLDRAQQIIELSDGSQLGYDLLLVTCGLQVRRLRAAYPCTDIAQQLKGVTPTQDSYHTS